jgi:mRNA interferase MazF
MTPKAYIAEASLALFCPVSSPVKGYPFELVLPEGREVIGVVLADQRKSLAWPARKAKLIVQASYALLAMVTARILPLLVPEKAVTL